MSRSADVAEALPAASAALQVSATTQNTPGASQENEGDPWADSVLEGLQNYPACPHCLMGPCITVSEVARLLGSCGPDITKHSKRHKDYQNFWKSLKDRGLWQHETDLHCKSSNGLSEVELRELMPQCVLNDTRKRYPNPPGVPYMGHRRA